MFEATTLMQLKLHNILFFFFKEFLCCFLHIKGESEGGQWWIEGVLNWLFDVKIVFFFLNAIFRYLIWERLTFGDNGPCFSIVITQKYKIISKLKLRMLMYFDKMWYISHKCYLVYKFLKKKVEEILDFFIHFSCPFLATKLKKQKQKPRYIKRKSKLSPWILCFNPKKKKFKPKEM